MAFPPRCCGRTFPSRGPAALLRVASEHPAPLLGAERKNNSTLALRRTKWGKWPPGTWAEYAQAYHATVVAKRTNSKGRRGCWLAQDVQDHAAGHAVSV